jgi:outer membrane receptor protein involved in Fe transport
MRRPYCAPAVVAFVFTVQLPAALARGPVDDDELVQVYGSKSFISIATGSTQPLRRAPAVATVITAEDIRAMGASDLDEVLETVPGMHVARSPINYEPLYVVRGIFTINNPQILVLLNGVPMTTLLSGSRGVVWGNYPVEHIARIEVIRGPGSALYGADAFSGVVNIITKAAGATPGTQAGVHAGSFRTRDAWVQHGGKLGAFDAAFYLRAGSTDGIREIVSADAQTARDKAFGTHASLAPGPLNNGADSVDANLDLGLDKWRARFAYKLRDNVGTGAGIASALDPVGKIKSERIAADLSWTDPHIARDWGMGLGFSALQYKQRVLTDLRLSPPGTRFPTGLFPDGFIGHPDTSERQLRLSSYVTYAGIAGHELRVGLGRERLDLYHTATIKNYIFNAAGVPVPTGPVIDYSAIQPFLLPQLRTVEYAYVQDEWRFARDWAATAGLRHDRYSDFGGTTNPRLALVWDASVDLTAKLLYGRAFRAPSFNESYGINNPVQRGNPILRPEKIGTLEAAFAWQAASDLQLNLNVFRHQLKEIIRGVPNAAAGTGATFQNTSTQSGRGLEVEANWDAGRNLRASACFRQLRLPARHRRTQPHRCRLCAAPSLQCAPELAHAWRRCRHAAGQPRRRSPPHGGRYPPQGPRLHHRRPDGYPARRVGQAVGSFPIPAQHLQCRRTRTEPCARRHSQRPSHGAPRRHPAPQLQPVSRLRIPNI